MAYVRDEQWETNLNRNCGRLFYCTDDLPLDVVELLGRLNIDIEKWFATYGCTYAAAAHAFSRALGHLP